jgi:succinyl-diaminopimelate desuccinylase
MSLLDAVADIIKANRDEVAQLCSSLINIPTSNPPGDGYEQFVRFLSQWFSKERIKFEIIRVPETELSALLPGDCHGPRIFFEASIGGKKDGPILYLQGHYDTVAPAGNWTKPPFQAETDGEKLWGLGASDMKGGLASMMMAMKVLAGVGGPPVGKVIFLATPDEEFASGANIRYLFARGKISGDFAVVGEFSGVENLFVGMKGGIWGDLKVRGRAAHGSQPLKGVNAFEKLARVMLEIEERFKPALSAKKSAHKFVPPEYDSPTVMIGGILRGSNIARSAVPHSATASFDLRTIPEDRDHILTDDFRDFLITLKERIPDLDLDMEVASQFPTYAVPEDSVLVQTFKKVIRGLTGKAPSLSISCAATEAAFFAQKGIPAVAYGPGAWQTAHAKDECVLVKDLEMASLVYVQAALLLLSNQSSSPFRGED